MRQVDAPALELDGLIAAESYLFEIHAFDASENQTLSALTLNVTTIDEIAPFWAPNANLALTWTEEDTLQVSWATRPGRRGGTAYSLTVNESAPMMLGKRHVAQSLSVTCGPGSRDSCHWV